MIYTLLQDKEETGDKDVLLSLYSFNCPNNRGLSFLDIPGISGQKLILSFLFSFLPWPLPERQAMVLWPPIRKMTD